MDSYGIINIEGGMRKPSKKDQGSKKMADIDQVMSKSSDNYRFHGVREATLSRLIAQAEDGNILLWGTDRYVHIDDDEFAEYTQGAGYLYTAEIQGWEICFDSFIDDCGLVLILEKQVEEPFEFDHPSDRRQKLIKVEEWKV